MSPVQERAMRAMLGSDFLFWAALRLMRDQMIGTMLATDPALVHAASAEDQARVDQVLRNILPVSRRQRGLMNDAVLAANPAMQDLGRIVAPTLAVSLEDDRFGTYDAARYMVSKIPGARLVGYPTGGHVWVGHDAELFAAVDDSPPLFPVPARLGLRRGAAAWPTASSRACRGCGKAAPAAGRTLAVQRRPRQADDQRQRPPGRGFPIASSA